MNKYHKGIMTLTLLILISSILLISMLFSDDVIGLHSAIASQRRQYLERDLTLQKVSQDNLETICSNVELDFKGSAVKIPIEARRLNDSITHYLWCKRYALFLQAPKVGVNQGAFTHFIDQQNLTKFAPHFQLPPPVLPKDKANYLYWFDKTQTEWQLNGNLHAVVVAEGDLYISGKGKISGAVITQGNLTKDNGITLAYRKATVTDIVQRYSRWERGEKSWYDVKQ
ncbi:MAG: DUF2572 family protein [Lonepinella koalarum]|nr:DUF2572 family protein [Lonepinella koalarum]